MRYYDPKIREYGFEMVELDPSSIATRPWTTSTGSHESLELAVQWFRECIASHEAWKRASVSFNPTRLLRLASDGGRVRLRLYCVKENKHSLPYVTLSHRWLGGASPQCLLGTNIAALQEYIPIVKLSNL